VSVSLNGRRLSVGDVSVSLDRGRLNVGPMSGSRGDLLIEVRKGYCNAARSIRCPAGREFLQVLSIEDQPLEPACR
jgi:hypothetical protein